MIKRNLSLFVCITSFFLVCGCLKSNSTTSSAIKTSDNSPNQLPFLIEKVGKKACTFVYPTYKKNSTTILYYCLTECNRCPEEHIDLFQQAEYVSNELCPLIAEKTKYINKTLPDFSLDINKYKYSIRKTSKNNTLEGMIRKYGTDGENIYDISPKNIIENDEDIINKCSRYYYIQSSNKYDELTDASDDANILSTNTNNKYKVVRCNGQVLGFTNTEKSNQVKTIWNVTSFEKRLTFPEAKRHAATNNGRLPTEKDCSEELIDTASKFLQLYYSSNEASIYRVWLSTPAATNLQKTCTSVGKISESHITDVGFSIVIYKKTYTANLCSNLELIDMR